VKHILALVALLTFSCPAMCAGTIVVSTPAAKGGEPAAPKYTPEIVENLLQTLRVGGIPQATMDEGVNKFLQRNGKTWEENPYLPEFTPYIPKDSLSENEKLQLAMYLWACNDFDNAIPLLNNIREDNPAAQGLYAVLLYTGRGMKKDERTGKKMFEDNKPALMRLALANANREAIIALALGYATIPKDATGKSALPEGQAVAAPLLKKSDPVAIMMLAPANITPTGSGSMADGVAAITRAAELGLPPAEMMLGVMFKDGLEKPKDGAKAVYWLTKAADGRMMPAQLQLGEMYWNGAGVAKDQAKALEWYHKASDMRCAAASRKLGYAYEKGIGTKRDTQRAVEFYRHAVKYGDITALNNLGTCYYDGIGLPWNYKEAYILFGVAAALGEQSAPKNKAIAAERLTPDQIKQADAEIAARKAAWPH